ncbi:MAG: 30S ribosomal protein S1 [Spirochaetales bacterium]|uniref:30S ribosomal protein S1 n=1 Tax=Candidatus Thalassospirochaeta sargassi TaxID=3119039 RepID=A0AAJ1II06_9SPIO|nr:30S ribosomal protein S1 [Spirochaetales bacterium]
MDNNQNINEEENFAEMFENSLLEMESFKPGQQIETQIVSISGNTIFLQLSGKSEGILDREELTDKEGNCTVKEGETIKVFFLSAKNGEKHFTTKISGDKADNSALQNAYSNGIPVEGHVEKEIKGGFEIRVGGTRAFCPYSQMGKRRVEDASEYVGQNLTFKIIEYKENGRNILVSNRAIHEEERRKQLDGFKETLKEGEIIHGVVAALRNFGAFVDLGGIQALLPISEISRKRIDDIADVLTVGQEIDALIISLDWQTERISLSLKALEADPWDGAAERYPVGSKQEGEVVRIADFGLFVSLEPGLDGLVHVSELKDDPRDSNPQRAYKRGQSIAVVIASVDEGARRISLKTAAKAQDDEAQGQFMGSDVDSETYNPFASLLKNKKS